ncbi:hypothetical protein [Cytobacillus massiliigabonensis]|uniref:hypothetical protein n=1 Tax=Cytobacillus massiliigabonensis TaxID=1871011 RepID=UPI000C81C900|nr:hypothetical protein [Cytobacillus massiliigabonensis]
MNPFKQVYDAAIERGQSEYDAINCAKVLYADHVALLHDRDYSPEFILESFNKYTRQLSEVLRRGTL